MSRLESEFLAANLHMRGDTFYHAEMFTTAYVQFTNSIQYSKLEPNVQKRSEKLKQLYAKRSLTLLKMGNYKKCLEDVQCALKMQHEDVDDVLNELCRIRKIIIENVLKTDVHLSTIPEDVELVNKPIELETEAIFDDLDEALIMKPSSSLEKAEDNNNNNDDFDTSASLEDLLDECDEDEEKIVTLETVMQQLATIEGSSDDDDTDSTLTDNTLTFSDFVETESSFLSEEEFKE